MEWHNHKFTTAVSVYATTGNLELTIMSTVGSIIPDILELGGILNHRSYTHLYIIYLIPLFTVYITLNINHYLFFIIGVLIGCLIHIAEDSLSKSGVPYNIFDMKKKYALNLYTTHHASEYLITFAIIAAFTLVGLLTHNFSQKNFANQIYHVFSYARIRL